MDPTLRPATPTQISNLFQKESAPKKNQVQETSIFESALEQTHEQQINKITIENHKIGFSIKIPADANLTISSKFLEIFPTASIHSEHKNIVHIEHPEPELLGIALRYEIENKQDDSLSLTDVFEHSQKGRLHLGSNLFALNQIATNYYLHDLKKEIQRLAQYEFKIFQALPETDDPTNSSHASDTPPIAVIINGVELSKVSDYFLKYFDRTKPESGAGVTSHDIKVFSLHANNPELVALVLSYYTVKHSEENPPSFKEFVEASKNDHYLIENFLEIFYLSDFYGFNDLKEELKKHIPMAIKHVECDSFVAVWELISSFADLKDREELKTLMVRQLQTVDVDNFRTIWKLISSLADISEVTRSQTFILTKLSQTPEIENFEELWFLISSFSEPSERCKYQVDSLLTLLTAIKATNVNVNETFSRVLNPLFPTDITSLDLSLFKENLTNDLLLIILKLYPNLEELNLTGCSNLTDRGLGELSLPYLKNLNLNACRQISDEQLVLFLTNHPQIQQINLEFCDQLTGKNWKSIPSLPNLTVLNLKGCNLFTDKKIRRILILSPNLHDLDLEDCSRLTGTNWTSSHPLSLKKLNLKNCRSITDANFIKFINSCGLLEELNTSGMLTLKGEGWKDLAPQPFLVKLNLSIPRISEEMLSIMLRKCSKLEEFELSDQHYLEENNWEQVSGLPSLQSLNFGYSNITDTKLAKFIRDCGNIQKLILGGCNYLTGLTWPSLPQLQNITYLDLSKCTVIENDMLPYILSRFQKLTHLSLGDCHQLTGSGWRPISFPDLVEADLSYCHNFPLEKLTGFITHAPKLERIYLNGSLLASQIRTQFPNLEVIG